MKMPGLPCLTVACGLLLGSPGIPRQQSRIVFVGTTPCGDAVRGFVGGMPPGAVCHAIRWDLTLDVSASRWRLNAVYGVPPASNPGAMIDGPAVRAEGTFTTAAVQRLGAASALFRLTGSTGSSIAFARIGDDLVNLARDDGSFVPGTSGWSYTLTRADRLEAPVAEIAPTGEGSYSMPPKETGPKVFAIFGGRSPCAGLAREWKLTQPDGCARIKWRLTLLKDPRTDEPTIYKVESSLNRARAWTGAWRIVRGAPGLPDAALYQLDADASHGTMLLLRADDNLVLFADRDRRPLPGTADFSYTLTRSDR